MNIFAFIKKLFTSSAHDHAESVPPVIASPSSDSPPNGGATTGAIIGNVVGATTSELVMINQAIKYINMILPSKEFEGAVLSHSFVNTNGKSNAEILAMFTSSTLKINVSMFTGSWKLNHLYHTQGIDEGDGVVYANRYYITNAYSMASLILHEYAHQLGFHHDYATQYDSVPYSMNDIFEHVAPLLGIVNPSAAYEVATSLT